MGGRARSRSPREAKQFVGRLCQTPILSIKAVSQKRPTESFDKLREQSNRYFCRGQIGRKIMLIAANAS